MFESEAMQYMWENVLKMEAVKFFKKLSSTNFTWAILDYFGPYTLCFIMVMNTTRHLNIYLKVIRKLLGTVNRGVNGNNTVICKPLNLGVPSRRGCETLLQAFFCKS